MMASTNFVLVGKVPGGGGGGGPGVLKK
eukprot:COSAG02_NODE_16195_length_1105_cov_1.957256_1_plen_27_part_10